MLPVELAHSQCSCKAGIRLPVASVSKPSASLQACLDCIQIVCKTVHCAVSFTMSTLCSIPAVNEVNEHKHKQTQAKAHRLANGFSVFISYMIYDA